MHVLETCTSTQSPTSCSQPPLTVYVSPAQKTCPDCSAGPSVPGLDVVTAVLLPFLCEPVSPPAPCHSQPDAVGKGRGRDSSHQFQSTGAARRLSLLRPCPPRAGADQAIFQPAESSTSAASRPASIPRPEAQPSGAVSPPSKAALLRREETGSPMITHGSSNCFPPVPRDLKMQPASGGHLEWEPRLEFKPPTNPRFEGHYLRSLPSFGCSCRRAR